ncbi:MAG: methionine synthase [Dehalococcoidia bacterium]|nr:methionine synthase [Dehalococcoidia bacterium]
MTTGLWTTAVGSYPKPDYLLQARNKAARKEITPAELNKLERQATEMWMRFQDELSMDLPVDGEMYRGDMAAYFAENMEGFTTSGLVRSYGNRYYRKPIAKGAVGRKGPITVEWWRYAQSLTSRPVKGMLTGPYTIADWSFDEHYSTREAFIMDLARAIHDEAADLEKAGAQFIQIDEPAVSVRPEEMEIAVKAMAVVTKGLKAHTLTHMCYGNFDLVYPGILRLAVDQIDLEMANSNYDLLAYFKKQPFTKYIGLGVVDVHTHKLETVEEVKRGIKLTMEVIPPERIFVDPDCGLKTRQVDEAKAKLKLIAQAVREVKKEMGISDGPLPGKLPEAARR